MKRPAVIFLCGAAPLVAYVLWGVVNPWTAVAMIVLAFAGTQLSRPVLERMGEETFRAWTRWTVVAAGTFYLASGCAMLA